ncbi:50S ribosomal protein L29 [Candidatus Gracilibacteria bacterium GN02-873]|jgi:ribosomal protein L29|nr:50S ribosomal protein L29 [Candidatus Gracilibacteria bacterium]MDO4873920.1 50S ribosomal protein L29 [Candidatus Gracilibacteria bacterium]RAL55409.1 50S ribosomal protein L29 [Candidatus Gracilibacteria bacterium GN02-873]
MAKTQKATSNKRVDELKALEKSQLLAELAKAQKELFVLTMKKDLGELKQTHLIRAMRKDIARISTFLSSSL